MEEWHGSEGSKDESRKDMRDGVLVKTPRPKGWVASARACGQKVSQVPG